MYLHIIDYLVIVLLYVLSLFISYIMLSLISLSSCFFLFILEFPRDVFNVSIPIELSVFLVVSALHGGRN